MNAIQKKIIIIMIVMQPATGEETLQFKQNIDLQAGWYQYTEPNYMNLKGSYTGIQYQLHTYYQQWYQSVSINYKQGKVDYTSNETGSANNQPNWFMNNQLLLGVRLRSGITEWIYYTGFGYRYLHHDGKGSTTTNHQGYDRYSRYYYLPLGMNLNLNLQQSKISLQLQYNHLIYGQQISTLMSRVYELDQVKILSIPFANDQRKGHGWIAGLAYNYQQLFVGVTLDYWSIQKSDPTLMSYKGYPVNHPNNYYYIIEPTNSTLDVNIRLGGTIVF